MKDKKASLTTQDLGIYSGQECLIGGDTKRFFVLDGIVYLPFDSSGSWVSEDGAVTPILRSLASMTEDEATEFLAMEGKTSFTSTDYKGDIVHPIDAVNMWYLRTPRLMCTPEGFLWLIGHGFDVFGWIEKGLAIEKEL